MVERVVEQSVMSAELALVAQIAVVDAEFAAAMPEWMIHFELVALVEIASEADLAGAGRQVGCHRTFGCTD